MHQAFDRREHGGRLSTSIFLLEVQTSEGAHHSQCLKRLSADLIEVVWQRITLTSGGEPSSESRANSMRTRDLFGIILPWRCTVEGLVEDTVREVKRIVRFEVVYVLLAAILSQVTLQISCRFSTGLGFSLCLRRHHRRRRVTRRTLQRLLRTTVERS